MCTVSSCFCNVPCVQCLHVFVMSHVYSQFTVYFFSSQVIYELLCGQLAYDQRGGQKFLVRCFASLALVRNCVYNYAIRWFIYLHASIVHRLPMYHVVRIHISLNHIVGQPWGWPCKYECVLTSPMKLTLHQRRHWQQASHFVPWPTMATNNPLQRWLIARHEGGGEGGSCPTVSVTDS